MDGSLGGYADFLIGLKTSAKIAARCYEADGCA